MVMGSEAEAGGYTFLPASAFCVFLWLVGLFQGASATGWVRAFGGFARVLALWEGPVVVLVYHWLKAPLSDRVMRKLLFRLK